MTSKNREWKKFLFLLGLLANVSGTSELLAKIFRQDWLLILLIIVVIGVATWLFPRLWEALNIDKIKFPDSDGFCGLGLKVGSDGNFSAILQRKHPQKAQFLLSNGTL